MSDITNGIAIIGAGTAADLLLTAAATARTDTVKAAEIMRDAIACAAEALDLLTGNAGELVTQVRC